MTAGALESAPSPHEHLEEAPVTTTETFYEASGSSPPSHDEALRDATAPSEPLPLPPELIDELARLLAEAIVADIRQYPNLAELKANSEATVESPSGHHRRRRARASGRGPRAVAIPAPSSMRANLTPCVSWDAPLAGGTHATIPGHVLHDSRPQKSGVFASGVEGRLLPE